MHPHEAIEKLRDHICRHLDRYTETKKEDDMEACPHCYQWQLQYAPSGTNKNAYIAYCEMCGFNEERENEQAREDEDE